jgi:glycosyltransferase involved in cell wall biosynthesis
MAKMRALLLTESYLPSLGGVEKHIAGVLPHLEKAGVEVEIISVSALLGQHKKIKFLTLLQIWWLLAKNVSSLHAAEVILIHDVFIYYLPFALLMPRKKIITTFHGYEKVYPIPLKNILYKKLAQKFSAYTISIGSYINKYYQLSNKNNFISYGAVEIQKLAASVIKKKNSFLFLGRLEKDTGLSIFLEFLDILRAKRENFSVIFCGDGPMRKKCQDYGKVLGFVNPESHLAKSEHCFAGGYLSILEAMANRNFVLSAYDNPLKKDYLLISPFAEQISSGQNGVELFKSFQKLRTRPQLLENNYQLAKNYNFTKLSQVYLNYLNQIKK